ncbi:hypothetical protein GCM10009677_05270 [Sphaerisporangium rubeum]
MPCDPAELVTVHVCDMGHVLVLAYRASALRWLAVVSGRTQKVGMSIAHITLGRATRAKRLDRRPLREAVIHDPSL